MAAVQVRESAVASLDVPASGLEHRGVTQLPSILEEPMYPPSFASTLVGVSKGRVSRWLRGYAYKYVPAGSSEQVRRRQQPLVKREDLASPYASFLDLVDLLFVKGFLDHGISLQKIRRALTEAEALLGERHFAQRDFWTDGRHIYLQVREETEDLLELLSGGQWVIAPVIKQHAQRIDFAKESGLAERWYPLGRSRHIVLDPTIAFGRPSLVGRGVETANLYDLFLAEGNSKPIAEWMGITPGEVDAAVEFESAIRAA